MATRIKNARTEALRLVREKRKEILGTHSAKQRVFTQATEKIREVRREIKKKMRKHKVYILYTVDDGKVFYVGYTSRHVKERLIEHKELPFKRNSRGDYSYKHKLPNRIRKLIEENREIAVQQILTFETEEEAKEAERRYIKLCLDWGFDIVNTLETKD